jgi:hypothetical protein
MSACRSSHRDGLVRSLGRIRGRHLRRSIDVIPLSVYLYVELVAAGALALWVLARFPHAGPRSMAGALGILIVALAGGSVAPTAIAAVVRLPYGIYAALLGCVLPVLFAMLLATGWLLRSLLAALGGSSGGPGHRSKA